MKIALSLALWLSLSIAYAQTFKKYLVEETGAAVYFPAEPAEWEMSYSDDSAKVFTNSVTHNDFEFAAVVVQFNGGIIQSLEEKDELLLAYLDYLKGNWGITEAAGYGWGHRKDKVPGAAGVIDFWKDEEEFSYAVKAWCNDYYLAVLYISGIGDYPNYGEQQLFLDGFRFPGE